MTKTPDEDDYRDGFACPECNMWYKKAYYNEETERYECKEEDKVHDCQPDVTTFIEYELCEEEGEENKENIDSTLEFYMKKTVRIQPGDNILASIQMAEDELAKEEIYMDTGTGLGFHNWDFEAYEPAVRLKIIAKAIEVVKKTGVKTNPVLVEQVVTDEGGEKGT